MEVSAYGWRVKLVLYAMWEMWITEHEWSAHTEVRTIVVHIVRIS